MKKNTPSSYSIPSFILCPPVYSTMDILNNQFMLDMKRNDKQIKIDNNKFMKQWFNIYKTISSYGIVYLLPPKIGNQDQCYINSFVYLPHIEEDTCILSNFTAKGRNLEEPIVRDFLEKLGYTVVQPPYKFEGEPELKWLRDNIYFGGYGQRTEFNSIEWLRYKYNCNIIEIKETDPYYYHLDCLLFNLDNKNSIVCTELINKNTLKEIEKYTNVNSVDKDYAYSGICNLVKCGNKILNHSPIERLTKKDKDYSYYKEMRDKIESICFKYGLEVLFYDLSEAEKQGASLSCFVGHLNYK